ncbi:MAG: bifunctional phosphoglucose/phosphomannose isomerase [candidate division WOR-3 bacterium]|nr:MAG: bifunctional phosphoglucose/phosphomannose isomerase [candidate division WOR-3 bacterium]
MMREIIYSLPEQISEAVNLVSIKAFRARKYEMVLICGMGGSGISGEILSALYPDILIVSNKDYDIPRFVGRETLAIIVSYSGNTEETLNNYRHLSRRKIDMVLISSNGKLLKRKAHRKICIPGGLPPRGALGYLFTPLPITMYQAGFIKNDPRRQLLALSAFLGRERDRIEKKAKNLAARFFNKMAIIYADSAAFLPVANRWRCQLNENAKVLAHINVIPEMNHNEIVGLGRPRHFNKDLTVVFLSDPRAHPRNKLRKRLLESLVGGEIRMTLDISPRGNTALQQMFWTIMLGDFISYYLALKEGVDPMPVTRIERLKKEMSKHK